MQNIKDWPLFVKICFGSLIAIFAIAGVIELPKLTAQNSSEQKVDNKLVDIDILIYTENRKPLEGVEVRFILKGSPVVKRTNTDGYTQIQIPALGDIDIELQKQGFNSSTYNIDPQIDPNKNREYILKPIKQKK